MQANSANKGTYTIYCGEFHWLLSIEPNKLMHDNLISNEQWFLTNFHNISKKLNEMSRCLPSEEIRAHSRHCLVTRMLLEVLLIKGLSSFLVVQVQFSWSNACSTNKSTCAFDPNKQSITINQSILTITDNFQYFFHQLCISCSFS